MTFLTPLLAGIVAAIAIPSLVILYFLKLRRRDLEVSTTLLWRKAIQDLQANAPFQKLRRNILLLLQLLILLAAIFALAQPEFRSESSLGQRSVILIDRSASMNATDGESSVAASRTTRLEIAKKRAVEFVDALREPGVFSQDKGDEAMVIAFDSEAIVRQNFTTDKAVLRAAIESIEPSDAPTSIAQAFKLSKAYTGTQKFEDQVVEQKGFIPVGPGASIHVFSDGRIPDALNVATALEDRIVYHTVGSTDAANVGIVGLRAERKLNDPSKLSIYIGLMNTDHEKRAVDVHLSIDQQVQAVRTVNVSAATAPERMKGSKDAAADAVAPADPNEDPRSRDWKPGVGGVEFTLPRAEGGVVTVELRSAKPDALATDDVGYLVFPPAKRLSVALVTAKGDSFFVRSVLEGLTLNKLDRMTVGEYELKLASGKAGEYDVAVFDNCLPRITPADGQGDAAPGLPPGRSLVMGQVPLIRGGAAGKASDVAAKPAPPGGGGPGLVDDGPGDQAIIVNFVRDHPALKHASLDSLIISKSRKVSVGLDAPVQVLASTQDGPAILEVTDGPTRAIVVPFDPAQTNWPLDPGYILFIAESIYYLTDTGIDARMVKPGSTLAETLPPGAKDVRLTLPDRTPVNLIAAGDGSVSYSPVRSIGIHTISWVGESRPTDLLTDGRARRPIAANLLDPDESDIPARTALAMAREVVQDSSNASAKARKQLWPWLLLAALGVVMLEWFVYNKKVSL